MALEDINECLLSSVLTNRKNNKQSRRNTSLSSTCILREEISSYFFIPHLRSMMKIFVVLLLVVLYAHFNDGKNVCRFPRTWKTYAKNSCFLFLILIWSFSRYDFDYKRRQNEWSTTNAKTDYYKLVLSWSPSFCKHLPSTQRNHTFQCQYDDIGIIV